MSVVRTCQAKSEQYCGVSAGVSEIVALLHKDVQGCYETEHGLTDWYGINIGTGQGCVNGATRAKLALALTQRTINKLCKGYAFATDEQRRITSLWYCDDACLLSDSPQELLLMMECCWMIAQMSGLTVTIKGKKKTAWMGTYWDTNEQGRPAEKDIICGETWKMEFPGGEEIPQILIGEDIDYYKHLGSELTSGWGGGQDRERGPRWWRDARV